MTRSSEAPTRRFDLGVDLLVFLAGLALYAWTLAPGLLPADAGEYQLIGAALGVAHPPGYALYTIVSWLTTKALFWLAPAQAITALSAVLAAGALALINRAGRTLSGSLGGGLLAALGLAASTTFWAQATTANVRMPTAFALTLALAGLTALWRQPQRRGALATTGFGLGLMTSHHPSTIFLAAVLGLAALGATWRGKDRFNRLAWLIVPAVLPFVAWLYFPLNANGVGAPANLATFDGFLQHITARGFGGDMLGFANARELPERWPVLVQLIGFQWPWALVALMVVGVVIEERGAGRVLSYAPLSRDGVRSSLLAPRSSLVLGAAIHAFIAITYRAPQTTEYLLPTYVLMALALSGLLSEARWPAAVRGLLALAAVVLSVWQIGRLAPSYRELAADTSTDAYARSVLDLAPQGAAVLAPWHYATPMWYLQRVEGRRPDVEVVYVLNQGEATYGESWLRDIQRFLPERPVVLTGYDHAAFDNSGLRFEPLATPGQPAWLVAADALSEAPAGLSGGRSFDGVQLIGAREVPSLRADQRTYLIAWRLEGAPRDVSFFVHALSPSGALVAQDDQRWAASRFATGEVLVGRYTVTVPPDGAPEPLTLSAGAYLPDGTLLGEAPLGTWADPTPPALPANPGQATLTFSDGALPLSFDNQVIVTNVAAPNEAHPGERIVVVVDMLAARALDRDLTLSLRADGEGWSRQYDLTPIGGALPTLKWVAGAALQDRIGVDVPTDAAPGIARLSLGWYDAFSQRDLPPLDPVFAQQGLRVLISEIEIH